MLALVILSLASYAFGTVYFTSPTEASSAAGGQPLTVSWIDDNTSPSLADFGAATGGLYVGGVNTQILLQALPDVDASQSNNLTFIPDPSVGGNSAGYFIRFDSANLKNTTTGYPVQSFSAKFTLTSMNGQFNSTVQALIDGTSSSSTVGATTPSTPSSTPSTPSAGAATSQTSASTTSTKKSTSGSVRTNFTTAKTWGVIVVGIVIGVVIA